MLNIRGVDLDDHARMITWHVDLSFECFLKAIYLLRIERVSVLLEIVLKLRLGIFIAINCSLI